MGLARAGLVIVLTPSCKGLILGGIVQEKKSIKTLKELVDTLLHAARVSEP
jgi:hypothetical protein